MNGIDPNNNYGGGKVKFFTGGSGGGGQTIQLLPIIIGSNNMTTYIGGGMLPLNSSYYINDGGDTPTPYTDNINATSYLPPIFDSYYYYVTNGVIQALTSNDVDVQLELYIDGVSVETILVTLNASNSYTSTFQFTMASPLNQYQVRRYGIRVYQTSGTGTQFLVSASNVFLSVFDEAETQREFFTSSNVGEVELVPTAINYFGFGGQTSVNSTGTPPLMKSIVGDVLVTEIWKVYFMITQEIDLGGDDIILTLYIDSIAVETFTISGVIYPYEPVIFTLSNPTPIGSAGNVYIKIANASVTEIVRVFEVGICGLELN